MTNKLHTCYVCHKTFFNAIYWFDSLYYNNFDKRIIRPFCGPICSNRYRDTTDVNVWPDREKPFPKGDEWKTTQNIDFMDYESD
jgi:hypothetical protein